VFDNDGGGGKEMLRSGVQVVGHFKDVVQRGGIYVICLPRLVGLHLRPGQRPAGEADWSSAEGRFPPG